MSYIPASAMPHAKPHEHDAADHEDHAGKPKQQSGAPAHAGPWGAALAISGALAIGAAATAFVLSRRGKSERKQGKNGSRKSGKNG